MLATLVALSEVFFAFDSSALTGSAHDDLARVAEAAKAHPDEYVVIEGHCDPIGTSVYNTGLSIRRVEAVHDQLLKMGVDSDRIVLAYYGENGARRATYAQDRRASIYLTHDSLADITDKTLDAHGIAIRWVQPRTVAQIEASSEVALR